MCEVIGFDGLNQCVTGEVSMTLTGNRVDNHCVPVVLIAVTDVVRDELSKCNRDR